MPDAVGRRSVLREPAFLRLWAGATASGLATWALPFVLGLALLDGALGAAGLGVVLAARTLGFLAGVPVGGVLADRHSRRAVVRWAALLAALATPLIAAGLERSVPLMAVAAAVTGAGQGACRPAFQALTAEVVDVRDRARANAAMTMAVRVTVLVAPGATASLALLLDATALLTAIALLWLAAALLPPPPATAPPGTAPPPTSTTDPPAPPPTSTTGPPAQPPARTTDPPTGPREPAKPWDPAKPREPVEPRETVTPREPVVPLRGFGVGVFLGEFADGMREARRHPWFLAGLAALTAVIATGYSATGVVLPLVSRDLYGAGAVLAAATTAYTVGALVGALLVVRRRPSRRAGAQGWAALAGLACYGFAPLGLLFPVHPAVVVAAYAVAGAGIEVFNVPWFTATQREVDPRLLARVSSLDFLLSYGLAPLGLALIAPAIGAFGAAPVLAACALTCFLAPALAALAPGARHFGHRVANRH
ncbi:MFS transporter [Microtetraspora sp. NBRC 13810]|uniref:MFS transporter n=1 Tax=Microtetraspora sp. NBRC 13810 TaxID=3030990 RepID=UPI00255598FA|nr:MFS transporter [Microtetraspora sp. NBRC 13810]